MAAAQDPQDGAPASPADDGGSGPQEREPWYVRATAPLRSEAAAFNVVLGTLGVALVVIGVVLVVRAL